MAVLLNCKLCGGLVASDAGRCPHCGTPNYLSDDYLNKLREAQECERIEAERHNKELHIDIQYPKGRSARIYVWIDGVIPHYYDGIYPVKLLPGVHEIRISNHPYDNGEPTGWSNSRYWLHEPIKFAIQEEQKIIKLWISCKYTFWSNELVTDDVHVQVF